MSKNVFERVEKKYLVTGQQQKALLELFADKMTPDAYGDYTISNLYFDTARYDLIRASLEKPVYKEKLRLRSYGRAQAETPVFLELKKKYKGVVYKRRITLPYSQIPGALAGRPNSAGDRQILGEIHWFMQQYENLSPMVYLRYQRSAWAGPESGLRVTFDRDIRFRQQELRLDNGDWGTAILEPGMRLMEIKAEGAYPLWLSRALSEIGAYPTSFSKYGKCYTDYILPGLLVEQGVRTSA